jgi:hypothetical protein
MSEEFKIMPTEGSAEIASLLNQTWDALPGESESHPWWIPYDPSNNTSNYDILIPYEPSNNTSNYDIFKTTESFPLYILGLRTSDFPLKNAPCKNAHPLSLPHFELFAFISAFVLHWPSYFPL